MDKEKNAQIEQNPRQPAVDAQGEPVSLGEYNGFEVYPMPMFVNLEASDPAATRAWYEEALGFGVMFVGPEVEGKPVVVHLRRKKYQDILLVPARPGERTPPRSSIGFTADGEVEALAARARRARAVGLSSVEGPVLTPWFTRELRLTDPDGHRLVFSERASEAPSTMEEWQGRVTEKMRSE